VDRNQPDLIRIPNFKTTLHWSLKYLPYTRSEWSIVTPLDCPKDLPADQVGNYVRCVYRFCIDIEGVQKASNRDQWLKRDPRRDQYRPPVVNEIGRFPEDHPQSWQLDPCALGPHGTRLNLAEVLIAKRRQSCPALTNDPPLIYLFHTYYRGEVVLADPVFAQGAEGLPSSSADPGGVVTAPNDNIYLMQTDASDIGGVDNTNDLPPEEQDHDDQDVEMEHSTAAEDQQSTGPTTVTFRRDPNLPRGAARQKLLKDINQSHEAGQFYVDVVPPANARN
jgi:hypothetical protein